MRAKSADGDAAGDVVIPVEGNTSDVTDWANGQMKGINSGVLDNFGPGSSINAVFCVKVGDDMAGKQVTVSSYLSQDQGDEKPIVSNIAEAAFTVLSDGTENLESGLTVEAVPSIDFKKGITKDVPFKLTMKIINTGSTTLHYIQTDVAYSGKALEDMGEEEDFLKLGTIVSPGEFIILDDGSGYLPQLEPGDTRELTFECKIPKDYTQESVNLFLAAGSFESDSLTGDPVAQDMLILNSKVLDAQQPVPNPDPGSKPTPDPKPDPKPVPQPSQEVKPTPQVKPAKPAQKTAVKSPKTGDESGAAGWTMLMTCAAIAAVVTGKKKQDYAKH